MDFPSTKKPLVPVKTWIASTGVGKSRTFRTTAVKTLNRTKYDDCVVIAVDRHDLGAEQLDKFYLEHPDTALIARIWRGRGADDPEQPGMLMCWRNDEAEEAENHISALVSSHGFSVEWSLCHQQDPETGEDIYCEFHDRCGFQRQKLPANLWFCAHESVAHEVPEIFGGVLALFVDEDPLDGFFFGVEKFYEVALDALSQEPKIKDDEQRERLAEGRRRLHEALTKLPEGPVPLSALPFPEHRAYELSRIEWSGKIDVELRPDMDKDAVKAQLAFAAGNKIVIRLARLWRLIAQGAAEEDLAAAFVGGERYSGRITMGRDKDGVRVIRMKGINEPASGWRQPTIIGSATLDPELMRSIWPPRRETYWGEEEGRYEFKELPSQLVARPPHVVVRQVVDNSFSKTWMLPTDPNEHIEKAREILAMVLREASKFAPQRSLLIVHLGTEEVIKKHCCKPPWLELAHHGAVSGLDKWGMVRAAFVVGRTMPPAELITRQAEAISGEYIAQRSYVGCEDVIHTVKGAIAVQSFRHPHPIGQRLLRRAVWGNVLQEVGRTRYISREANDPLDIWLINDVPVPELGDVIPVQWVGDDPAFGPKVGPSIDDVMLTTGCWLENASDAKRAHDALITSPEALRKERSRAGSAGPYQKLIAGGSVKDGFQVVAYRRREAGAKKSHAIFLEGVTHDAKAWLEEKLGQVLAEFEAL